MHARRWLVWSAAAVVLAGAASVAVPASADVRAEVGAVRSAASGDVAYAEVTWDASPRLTGTETVRASLFASPTATAQLSVVGASRVGGTGSAEAQVTLVAPYTGTAINPGSGEHGAVGIRASAAGAYSGALDVVAASGAVIDRVTFSFTTSGSPVGIRLSTSDTTEDVGEEIDVDVQLLDASGRVTQPLAVDGVALSASLGSVNPTMLSGTGAPEVSLSDGEAQISIRSGAAGQGTLTATPLGSLMAWVAPSTLAYSFTSRGPTPSPSPSPTETGSPSPSPTPSPSQSATPTPSPTGSATPSPSPTATASPSPTPSPEPTSSPTPSPEPSPDPDLDGDEEWADSLDAYRLTSGKWRVEVTTSEPGTQFRIVGNRAGSKVRVTWKGLTTNQDGEFAFRTSRDLRGYRLRLIVDGATVARFSIPR